MTSPVRSGRTLGRYALAEVLGHGAMATVFRGRDQQLARAVAVKVMNFAVAARDDAGERFRREAQAVAALKHPNIVEIYDFAAATDEDPSYIVAELIDGPTLAKVVEERRGRLLPEIAALVAAQVAEALGVAHQRGIVHRDIKPDNVMLEKTGTAARVVITDFGVAHITGLETMTASGALVGSPAYMSPEQARGHDIGPATDVWAVGVLLYQMVTGTFPFAGREPFAVIAAIARGTFKRPSQVSPMVSPELERIILRCLQSAPGERYGDGCALAKDLHALSAAAGIDDAAAVLRRFLDDPQGAEDELRPRVADAAVERARRHVKRGELAKALSEVSRATAYVDNHRGADAVLRSISARRRWFAVAAVLSGVAVAGASAYLIRGKMEGTGPAKTGAAVSASVAPPPAIAPAHEADPVPRMATPPTAPDATKSASAAKVSRRPGRLGKTSAKVASRVADSPSDTPAVAEKSAPEPVAETKPEPAPPPPAPGRVTLNVSRGFCYPSVDDGAASLRVPAEFPGVAAGKHKIYCAVTRDGPKQLVGEIEVGAGAHVERNIKPAADGRPRF